MAVTEQDTVLNRVFVGVAFNGGGGAAAWTSEATSRSLKSPLSPIHRSVLEQCANLFNLLSSPQLGGLKDDKKEGRRRIRTRSQIVRVADARL